MRTRMILRLEWEWIVVSTAIALSLSLPAKAQQPSPDPSSAGRAMAGDAASQSADAQGTIGKTTDESTSKQRASADQDSAKNTPPEETVVTGGPSVRALGSAGSLDLNAGRFRWGPLSLRDVSFIQVFSRSDFTGSSAAIPDTAWNASMFQADIVFDRQTQRFGRYALQYRPRVTILNGDLTGDFANQEISLSALIPLSPRWRMQIDNRLSYFSTQNVFASSFVDADAVSGSTLQDRVLDVPGSYLHETVGVTFDYQISARTSFSFSPVYTYAYTEGFNGAPFTSSMYAAYANLRHRLTERVTVGGFFRAQYLTSADSFGNTALYSFGGLYAQQIGHHWFITGSFGATRNPGIGPSTPWIFNANAGLTRRFSRSSVALVYSRDLAVGYVTNQFADRVDALYTVRLNRHLVARAAVGYQREVGQSDPVWAKYVLGELNWRVAPRVSITGNYSRRFQSGDGIQIVTGVRDFASIGIRWYSMPESGSTF